MSMETALRSRLKNDAGVSALVGSRVDWTQRPQGTSAPCVVLTAIADNRDQHFQGFAGFRSTRIQIDCYAATKAVSVALREAIISAVVPEATEGGVTFLRSFINTVLDRGDQTETGFVHRELIDLTCWHNA
jgi:hypothetical protein